MGIQGFTRVYRGIQGPAGLHWLALLWDIWMAIWLGDYMVAYHELYTENRDKKMAAPFSSPEPPFLLVTWSEKRHFKTSSTGDENVAARTPGDEKHARAFSLAPRSSSGHFPSWFVNGLA